MGQREIVTLARVLTGTPVNAAGGAMIEDAELAPYLPGPRWSPWPGHSGPPYL
jgi:hypothetical protein